MKQYVTGLTVTHDTHVSKVERKEVFKHLFFCKKFGPASHLEYQSKHSDKGRSPHGFQDWLLGKISFIYSIDKVTGVKMFKEFEKINWLIDGSLV